MGSKPIIAVHPVVDLSTSEGLIEGTQLVYVAMPYLEAIVMAGGLPMIVTPSIGTHLETDYLPFIDGLMLVGGTTPLGTKITHQNELPTLYNLNPLRYDSESQYVHAAYQKNIPIFGVCRGMQVLNEILGGTMNIHNLSLAGSINHYQEIPEDLETHECLFAQGSRLAEIVGEHCGVNSFHRQAVKTAAAPLRITAYASDGTVEGVESLEGEPWVMGVQFHPELMPIHHPTRSIYASFISAAATNRLQRLHKQNFK